ncbi:MAG TPA: ADP-forming succinate--CoA ligase subunit beta [bacterium]|nr:ADP-forming succinate--CoA ligase subunit beta [bacterium]
MNIHEFQAKQVLAHFGVSVPRGAMTESVEGAKILAQKMFEDGAGVLAVKAQIHAGGRGKAGGVKLAKSTEEAEKAASEILGKTLVTAQTGPAGKVVGKLLIEEGSKIARELYVSLLLDRSAAMPAIVASASGGMNIEEVAAKTPEKIATVRVDPVLGLRDFQVRTLNNMLGLSGELAKQGQELFLNLFQAFMEMDLSLLEINPLVVTEDGKLIALDAKLTFDDSALFRHPDVAALRDLSEEAPLEVEAKKYKLNYIKLDGNVGCMVNGAGLAMATMDMIQTVGLAPANFLDVGGGADQEMIENAFRIILSDPAVKGVLINIFGGILRCDVLAKGIVEAGKKLELNIPMVIRIEGTNAEQGRQILAESGLNFTVAKDFKEAAQKLKEVMKGK